MAGRAARHRQVVRAVMISQGQEAMKPEAANLRDGPVAGRRRNNGDDRAAAHFLDGNAHRIGRAHHRGVRFRHPADCARGTSLSRHREARASGDRLLPDDSAHRDVVHVEEVLPQPLDVHLSPVRGRIGPQDGDNLGDGGEHGLAGTRRSGRRCARRMGHPGLVGVTLASKLHREQEGKADRKVAHAHGSAGKGVGQALSENNVARESSARLTGDGPRPDFTQSRGVRASAVVAARIPYCMLRVARLPLVAHAL